MRKNTFFFALIMTLSFGLNAQVISFEESEGYTTGNINAQSNWETTSISNNVFIANQIITDEVSSDGSYSLKLTKEPSLSGQLQAYVGAYYNYPTPISNENAVFSADIYLSEQGTTSFTSLMGLVDVQNARYRTYIDFFYDGSINVFVAGGTTGMQQVYTGSHWTINTWFNIKIETTGLNVKFYKDNVEIYEGILLSDGPIEQVRFVHDNYEGFGYIDNFISTGTPISLNKPYVNVDFTHFYNSNAQTLILETPEETFDNVFIYNTLGQPVISKNLSQNIETIDVAELSKGVYIVKLILGNATQSFKFFKE